MPEGPIGKIGVTVSPADPDRVWAIVEANEGGVFRSDDAGATWERTNDERKLRQRAFYYSRIYADPVDRDTVYGLNVGFYKSTDGGETFDTVIRPPHGDNHDLWIDSERSAPDDQRERRRRQRLDQRRRDLGPSRTTSRRSCITSWRRATFRTTCAAPSRTTAPSACRATAGATCRRAGRITAGTMPWAAASPAGSRSIPMIRTSSTPAAKAR